MSNSFAETEIPHQEKPSWEDTFKIEIDDQDENFVPLSLSQDHFLVRSAYYVAGYEGAIPECYARKEIHKRLLKASKYLPKGLRFIVLDTWRSKKIQTALYMKCSKALYEMHPDKSDSQIDSLTKDFVATPSSNIKRPSPHSTGGAIDLTIASTDGTPLFFGAPFDYPTEISHTRFFENKMEQGEKLNSKEKEALKNRRILFHAMDKAGFVNYHAEWWHFEYGTQRWALITNKPKAIYGYKKLTFNSFNALIPENTDTLVSSAS